MTVILNLFTLAILASSQKGLSQPKPPSKRIVPFFPCKKVSINAIFARYNKEPDLLTLLPNHKLLLRQLAHAK